jgi:hypothetical protein
LRTKRYQKGTDLFVPPTSQIIGLVAEVLKQHNPETFSSGVHLSHLSFHTTHFDAANYEVNIEIAPSEKGAQFSVSILEAKQEKPWRLYVSGSAQKAVVSSDSNAPLQATTINLACNSSHILYRERKGKKEEKKSSVTVLLHITALSTSEDRSNIHAKVSLGTIKSTYSLVQAVVRTCAGIETPP